MIREEPGGGQEGKQGRILRDNIKTGEKQGKHMEETGEDIGNQHQSYPKNHKP